MSLLQRSLTVVAAALCCIGSATLLHAQESFRATHICQLSEVEEGGAAEPGAGLGIFAVDRASLKAYFRISFAESQSPYTSVSILSRTAQGTYSTIQEFDWQSDDLTLTEEMTLIAPVLALLDAGNIYIAVGTEAHPDGFLRGQVEQIPSGVVLSLSAAEQTTAVNSDGEGSAQLFYDQATGSVHYVAEWTGLTGPATTAHIHRGARGVDGPVVHTLTFAPGDSVATGMWAGISTEDLEALRSGGLYVNVQTTQYPSGEIRGQITPAQVFTAAIESENEVPPILTSAATGTGVLVVLGSGSPGTVVVGSAVVGGTADSITMAHVHRGPVGVNGPVVMTLERESVPSYRAQENVSAIGLLNFATLDSIIASNSYMNVHTTSYPDGEARGQLVSAVGSAASVAVAGTAERQVALNAWSREGKVYAQVVAENRGGVRSLRLYSILGRRVAAVAFEGGAAEIDASEVPAGAYFLELVADGVPVGACPVMITR